MLVNELINDTIVTLRTSDNAITAISLMEEFKVLHLPIVNNEQFLGLISEEDIFEINKPEEPLGNHTLSLSKSFVSKDQHIYDAIRLFAEMRLTLLPVLDHNNNYLGAVTLADLVHKLSAITAVNNPGGVIILEVNQNDYSLSQIAQIVESNDAKVLSLYITSETDSTKLEITLKINKVDIRQVLQTFNRYDYAVKASYSNQHSAEDLKDRYDLLMKYLNM